MRTQVLYRFLSIFLVHINVLLHANLTLSTSLSTYVFSTLYTTLPHNLIKEKLLDLIERTFYKKEGKLYLACNDKKAFFTSANHYRGYYLWPCQNV